MNATGYHLCMMQTAFGRSFLALLSVQVVVLGGCASSQGERSSATARPDGWRAEATLAGRGGAGGTLAQWAFAPRADGTPDHCLLEQILKLAIAVANRQVVFG